MKRLLVCMIAGMTVLAAATRMVTAESVNTGPTQRAVLKVENLTCGGCFYSINNGLKPLEGFSGMGANLFRKLVAVDFIAPLTPETIQKTITGLGYPAIVDSVETVTKEETFAFLESKRQRGYGGGGCCGSGGSAAGQSYTGGCPGAGAAKGCPYAPGQANVDKEKTL